MKVFISHQKNDSKLASDIHFQLRLQNVDAYLDVFDDNLVSDGQALTEHLKSIVRHGGIGFLIISFKAYDECFLVMLDFVLKYVDGPTKSIPYKDLKENCPIIKYGYIPRLDYLNVLESILKDNF